MRLWLDDVRPMPEGFTLHVRTADEAKIVLDTCKVDFISFDHDLGPVEAGTGYDVACYIERAAWEGICPPDYAIHSANPVGRKNIEAAMTSAIIRYNDRRPNW